MKLNCEMIVNSDVEHLQQIYTGFSLLHQQNFLTLKQTIPHEFLQDKSGAERWANYKFFNTKVVINGKITVCYDLHDWHWIDEDSLREADFYFKRSYDAEYISQIAEKDKVFPLGLNYPIGGDKRDFFKLERAEFYQGKARIKAIVKSLKIADSLGFKGETEQLGNLEALPDFSLEPKILFMARAWDTSRIQLKDQTSAVENINETRAECIRSLRREFGERFFGGLAHDDYSIEHFKDCLLPDSNLSNKRRYLEIIKGYPICVATSGLNRSNGWKLGEYVALSKAILTEPLHYKVTGNFSAEKNYLEFTDSAQLLNAAARLFEDEKLRFQIMLNNYEYYLAFVKPDSLILQTLAVIAAHGKLYS